MSKGLDLIGQLELRGRGVSPEADLGGQIAEAASGDDGQDVDASRQFVGRVLGGRVGCRRLVVVSSSLRNLFADFDRLAGLEIGHGPEQKR